MNFACVLAFILTVTLLSPVYSHPSSCAAKFSDPNFEAELVVKGLKRPTGMVFIDNDDILVSEKQGKVQRIVGDHILPHPALDITSIVNSTGERGLLGIAVSQPINNGKNGGQNKDFNIYLFFTKIASNNMSDNVNCGLRKCEPLKITMNSLYRYKFNEGQLTDPKLLINVPLYSNYSIQHIGGALTVGPDKKIYFTTGDGRGCEYFEDCGSKAFNISQENESKGIGGIYVLNHNSETHGYNEGSSIVLGQYAYGIRNSFGLDFDPVTGNLWDTENGPTFGDEINLVKPGFNSGWPKIQGKWTITNSTQLIDNPPPGLPKGHYYSETPRTPTVFTEGKYSKPEFTWNQTVGVTSIKFFHSDKFGNDYKNDIFVGTYKRGLIYHFNLDKNRDQLLLKEPLADRVANNQSELHDALFVQGLAPGGITDLEVGPDGYLYVLTYGTNPGIYRIVPK